MPVGRPDPKKPARKRAKKASRRARGTGSIFFHEGKGRWVGRKVIGKKANGEPLKVERWGDTQREVIAKLEAALPPGEDTTVAAWAARWLSTLTVRPATRANYEEAFAHHLVPAIGHLPVKDVRPSRIEALAAALAKPAGDRKALHPNTVRKVLGHARTLFAAAVREELIPTNPVAVARKPKGEKTEIDPLPPAELKQVIAAVAGLSAGPLLALLAGTGCRLGEASALDVADWDPKAGTVAITKTYSRRFGLGPPKSKHSKRTITVPVPVRPYLVAAAAGRAAGPLFTSESGNRFIKSLIQRAFTRLLARLGLRRRSPHQLRHSVATMLISDGQPLGDVAKYLGDSVQTVVKTYLHPSGSNPAAALDRLLG